MTQTELLQRIKNLEDLIENKTILRDELSRAIFTMNGALGRMRDTLKEMKEGKQCLR